MERDAQAAEQDFRSTFRLRRVLIPILIGMVAAGWLLWRDLAKERYERVGDGLGDHAWHDANGNGIVDAADPAEFIAMAQGQGDYRRMTARETLGSINWTWHSTGWILLAFLATAF
ncbi:MAG: hypothetical protein ACK4L7_10845, partial [Flavobacteriales bacterium]